MVLSLSLIVLVPKFLQSLKELGDVDEEAISEAHLRTEYGKIQEQVRKSYNYYCTCTHVHVYRWPRVWSVKMD